ncbi:hypothetical protein SCHPADRAFT_896556 [Schizopora paradoxa]|uniref:Uncharacterized protein n=1 Tax=Schizopora paradoxa TaxID=27342 RepID=A0A0H2R6G5_9AGAM|nr:hypothetical protein SCHPADRAFT_896556 [Schizopora paradoxa]
MHLLEWKNLPITFATGETELANKKDEVDVSGHLRRVKEGGNKLTSELQKQTHNRYTSRTKEKGDMTRGWLGEGGRREELNNEKIPLRFTVLRPAAPSVLLSVFPPRFLASSDPISFTTTIPLSLLPASVLLTGARFLYRCKRMPSERRYIETSAVSPHNDPFKLAVELPTPAANLHQPTKNTAEEKS